MTDMDVAAGVSIPGLDLIERLGQGAQTEVFRCRHRGRDYAVKIGAAPAVGNAESSVGFRREAALLASARDPALPEIYEVGEAGGRPYMVMEFVEGRTLGAILQQGPLPFEAVLRLGADVAGGLAAAHRSGLVHLDVKPDNIIVRPDGRATLIDFGLAGHTGEETGDTVVGTLHYSSPEQTGMLKRPVDRRADLYSLGVVLFEATTGTRPFISNDPGEVIRMNAAVPAPCLGEVRPGVSPVLAAIVAKLLAKDPDDRYQSSEGLIADLRSAADSDLTFSLDRHGRRGSGAVEALPFVGRDAELDVLRQEWTRSRTGHVAEVVVDGPMGAGKSRLVSRFLDDAAADGPVVLVAACAAGNPVPFAGLREAFAGYLTGLADLDDDDRAVATARLVDAAGPFAQVIGSLSPQLADVLGVDPHTGTDDGQFSVTFALFVIELARRCGGLILWIDDAHWIDDATDEVVAHIVGSDDQGPLLVVRSRQSGDGDAGEAPAGPHPEGIEVAGAPRSVHLALGPIDDEALAGLVGARVRAEVDREFALGLAARAGGNPLVLFEYLGAVIEAGAMWPSWGTWQVDHAGLETLALPDDIVELLFRRIEQVGPAERSVLTVAAAAGSPFDIDLLRQVMTGDPGLVDRAIARSVDTSLVELRPGDRAAFVHERIAETLLSMLDPDVARTIHQRLAEVADTGDLDGDELFFVARHYRLGQLSATPARMVALGRRAGTAALDLHAAREALDFLSAAYDVAESQGVEVDAAFEQELGTAYLRSGQSEVAGRHYERSIERTDDPWVRATARAQLGRIDFLEGRYDQADGRVRLALREVGRPVPRNGFLAVLTSVLRAVTSTVLMRLRLRRPVSTDDVEERRRLAVVTSLYDTGGSSAYMRQEPQGMVAFALCGVGPGNRLGLSPELVRAHSSLCMLAAILHRRRAAARAIPRLQAMARDMGNPSVMATVSMNATIATEFMGDTVRAAEMARTTITEFGRWMEPGELQMLITLFVVNLGIRGHHAETVRLLELQARQPARTDDGRQETLDILRGLSAATMGRPDPTGSGLLLRVERVDRFDERTQRLNILDSLTAWALELGPQDGIFDTLVERRDREHVRMLTASHYDRIFWVDKAYGRVDQWRNAVAGGADRREVARRRARARSAVRQARLAAFGMHQPFLHTKAMMSRAMYARLAGRPRRAIRLMARVEQAAAELDAPALRLDVWCERARLLADRGLVAEAGAEIGLALNLTASQGWNLRHRVIREEFPHVGKHASSVSSSTGSRSATRVERVASESTSTSLPARRLDALLQVSVAAASVIVPVDLARIALDEALTILGAERAFLFQADAEEHLTLLAGRDGNAHDLVEAVGYSTTAVEQVRASRQALVVTGSDEGALIGSTSAVVHGLRSILVAPLQLEGRLTGIVYLDSRLAKGMFTGADVDILVAIATQVAVSLETARSAQLEMQVHTEREQRALVDTLRDVMADMTSTLDPGEVLDRMLAGLARAVPFDAAHVVVLHDGEGAYGRVLSSAGRTMDEGTEHTVAVLPSPAVMETLQSGQPVLDPDATEEPPGAIGDTVVGSWMAVPIQLSETTLAAVVVLSAAPFAYGETQLEIVRTVVAHGTVGYQNARLFTANRKLAVTDELSGLGNRRSFFDLATERLDTARECGQSLSLLMVDIDNFKQVNDTYGHPTGDDVIREVADRLQSVARAGDVVGRYGGEEFALLLSATPDTALAVAERFRAAVADEPVATRTGDLRITVSVGVTHVAIDDRSLEALLSRADGGLYEAKKGGRNLVVRR